jgi:signal transduction histidine kinase
VTPGEQALGTAENEFLADTTRALVLAALGAALLAVVVGGALSWQITRPMRLLRDAAHDLAAGDLGQQVAAGGTLELAELANAFNHMSRDLAAGEALRQRMAADIAHELRTPVSVLRGHLEAMLDGVFPLDEERLAVAYDRTIHLSRLVDDLRLLTRAEAGQLPLERARITPAVLVERAAESFAPLALDAGVTLRHEVGDDLPAVAVDADRMQQVLGNLLTNALRHTPAQGTITVTAVAAGDRVRFAIANTGESLSAEQAAQVFTPFWRAEQARERDRGGSGLGLAISRQLVMLHGGRIWAESGPGGATFVFELPGAASPQGASAQA